MFIADTRIQKLTVSDAIWRRTRVCRRLPFSPEMRPILLVLDPTPSHRLTDLTSAFRAVGGEAQIGDEMGLHRGTLWSYHGRIRGTLWTGKSNTQLKGEEEVQGEALMRQASKPLQAGATMMTACFGEPI